MAVELDPWRSLVLDVFEKLGEADIEKVLFVYRQYEKEVASEDSNLQTRFCRTVDNYTDKVKAARKLQNIFQDLKLKTFAEIVQQNIVKIAKYHQQFEVESLEKLVGRDKEVKFLMGIFEGNIPKVSGVCVCGIGGQGKSALAKNICCRLKKCGRWNIIKADLRKIGSVTDVLKSILAAAELKYSMHAEDKKLQELLVSYEKGSTHQGLDGKSVTQNTLFFLDNCDLVPQKLFKAFVQNILKAASQRTDDIKVYFLFTMRQKFETESSSTPSYDLKLENLLLEMELKALTQTDAVVLLIDSSGRQAIDDDIAAEIVKECAYLPLAITVVADLIKDGGKYQPDRLLCHLKMDQKNVTKQLKVDTCIQQAITNLTDDEIKAVVSLSVFQSSSFEWSSAEEILAGSIGKNRSEVDNILQLLHNKHLLDVEFISNNRDRKKCQFSLQPLVYRYISEQKKTKGWDLTYNVAVKKFIVLYEKIIGNIMRHMDTKYWKASRELEMHKVHILNFYTIMSENPKLIGNYPKESQEKDFLNKKRLSDLSDLLLSQVQKRRLFQSEADRALEVGNDAMYIFWMVEKADVFVLLHDKAEIAIEIIDDITNGRFPALKGLHDEPFYAPIVHALFHKVKGLCHWKRHYLNEAISHLELALKFYERYPETSSAWYLALKARVYRYIGQVYIDKGNLDEAEQNFRKGLNMVKAIIKVRDKSEKSNFDKERQWDVPMYYYHFAYIKFEKAKGRPDAERNELFESALADLDRGMKLDEWLQLDSLNGYYTKMKLKADIAVEKGNLADALTVAESVLNLRRVILQPPHTCYTESIYQVGRIHMLIGNECMSKGDREKAVKSWNYAFDYFDELSQHHLKNGGIALTNPTYQGIKRDHYEITKLVRSDKDLKRLSMFYMKLERGDFNNDKQSSIREMKKMLWTPMEMVYKFFGGGGKTFGDKDADLDKLQALGNQQAADMMAGGTSGGPRHDSGHGHSSSDFSDSFSSGSGSMSKKMADLKLNKSLSLEDDVFEESKEAPAGHVSRKNQLKKRQKTIDESLE